MNIRDGSIKSKGGLRTYESSQPQLQGQATLTRRLPLPLPLRSGAVLSTGLGAWLVYKSFKKSSS